MTSNSLTVIAADKLSGDMGWIPALVVAFVVLAGGVVLAGRRYLEGRPSRDAARSAADPQASGRESTLVRSWLAISLVGGLLIFVTLAFCIGAQELRSALVGGIVPNAGAAVVFYFKASWRCSSRTWTRPAVSCRRRPDHAR